MYTLEEIDNKQDIILEELGAEQAYETLCKAMTYDEKKEYFEYIIRVHDIDIDTDN